GLGPVSTDANDWPMYNHDPAGTRHNAAESQLNPRTVGRLEVKWRFPTEGPIAGTPAVVGNTVYAVDGLGWVYAVRRNGRELWRTHVAVDNFVSGKVSASLLVTDHDVMFGDLGGTFHCLNRKTGVERWQRSLDDHPAAAIYGSPTMVGKKVCV